MGDWATFGKSRAHLLIPLRLVKDASYATKLTANYYNKAEINYGDMTKLDAEIAWIVVQQWCTLSDEIVADLEGINK
ncbi:hypothetical protein [Corynebacterium sp. ES2775-CONJ]|uniref:hypothetical protein n=1 Tax=Corynebacterium sp. ES2775-CONJ TaxID=2974029 RepID=UPI00216A0B92|nr:hypothetical protein [Corynebacterium sp. ES2775-CONJ]MCS4489445.1 hypothetical protein [Corynebacterium sp. ES2775-CONJ]